MAKFSRDKGARNERLLRDYLRGFGWHAERVPLSGATPVMKGDVIATNEGSTLTFELKARKCSFKRFYEATACGTVDLYAGGLLVTISRNLADVTGSRPVTYRPISDKRLMQKVITVHGYLGSADILVLKDDRQPFLFFRFYL